MQTRISKPETILLPVIYGLCVFLFFWKLLPYHLHFQEQFQLFLFTKSYFIETCSRPGGFSNYAGHFIVQFYVSSFVGALLVSCLLTSIQQLVYGLVQRFCTNKRRIFLLISFLPSLFYWVFLCNENTQTGGVIALIFALIATMAGTLLKSRFTSRIYLFVCIPVLYWIAGGMVILSVILLIFYEWRYRKDATYRIYTTWILTVTTVCFVFILPVTAKIVLKQEPLYSFWEGVYYVHFTNEAPFPTSLLRLLIIFIVVSAGFRFKRQYAKTKTTRTAKSGNSTRNTVVKLLGSSPESPPTTGSQISYWFRPILNPVILLVAIYLVILKSAYPQNLSNEEVMAYDYHCRMKNWDKVIEMANRKTPTFPITVACLNLALYKTGQLPDKMFYYFQNGPEGLLLTYQRDFLLPMVGGEPYWYLGFVNTAQRFAFEAMEAFPNNQKSTRSIKRLAETNLINGYYEAASKYLYLLENTLFYKKWAKDTRTYLYNEDKIDAHPEWGEIRRFRTDEDFLFNEHEKDRMLEIYFAQHHDNRMAYEYLMAYALLTKNLDNLTRNFLLINDFTYHEIPQSYQEALMYSLGVNNNNTESIPFSVSASVKQQFIAYTQIYTSMQSPEPILRKQFPKTYWYYYHFRKYNQPNIERSLQY